MTIDNQKEIFRNNIYNFLSKHFNEDFYTLRPDLCNDIVDYVSEEMFEGNYIDEDISILHYAFSFVQKLAIAAVSYEDLEFMSMYDALKEKENG